LAIIFDIDAPILSVLRYTLSDGSPGLYSSQCLAKSAVVSSIAADSVLLLVRDWSRIDRPCEMMGRVCNLVRRRKTAKRSPGNRGNGVYESGSGSRGRFSRNEVSSSQGETRGRRVADRKPTKPAIQPSESVHPNGVLRQVILTSRLHRLLYYEKGHCL
jgi:hypothetical protein